MNKALKTVLTALLIAGCGIVLAAIYWLFYVGLTYLLEATLYQGNPQDMRQDYLRNIAALIVGILTILLMRTRLHQTFKAIFLLSGLSMVMIALVLRFYMIMWVAVLVVILLSAIVLWMIIRNKKPWIYTYALMISVVLSLFYAWPI
jgi:uncharacterized membrane protein